VLLNPSHSLPLSPDGVIVSRKRRYSDASDRLPSPPPTPPSRRHKLAFGGPIRSQGASSSALPAEMWMAICGWVDTFDHRTIRCISQTSRTLNRIAQNAFGPAYGAAHRPTLAKAMTLKHFDFADARIKSVLSGFCSLELFTGRRHSAPISWSKWQHLPLSQLQAVVAALPQVTSLGLGGDNPSAEVLAQLLAADFPFERLISLTLGDELLFPAHLPQLLALLPRAKSLHHLTFPGRLRSEESAWQERHRSYNFAWVLQMAVPNMAQGPISFNIFPELRSFTWHPAFMPPVLLDFSTNQALRHLTLAQAKLGPEQEGVSQQVVVRWPPQGVTSLHLWQCQLFPGFSENLTSRAMQQNLVELVLDVDRIGDALDLTAFEALRCLKILGNQSDLSRVLPPTQAPLERLTLQGHHQGVFLRRLGAWTYPKLRYFSLTVPHDRESAPLPFGAMANIRHFVFRDHTPPTSEAPRTTLADLDLPAHNAIDTLTLEGSSIDPTLGRVSLPHLRRLELSASVPSKRWGAALDALLSRQPQPWPRLERVVVRAHPGSATTRDGLGAVLARHDIALLADRADGGARASSNP